MDKDNALEQFNQEWEEYYNDQLYYYTQNSHHDSDASNNGRVFLYNYVDSGDRIC